ncbi:hypothetical protein KFK09_023420 [Dendrobium nobile]|uniref:Uncharacterized protein n=1 Tax=Dendrobium nobile TaxID=94219 RepID=A0A8T3AMS2_DENNO|nr:hypothetical protein KFK09_023420 [Dendrobium nobile]
MIDSQLPWKHLLEELVQLLLIMASTCVNCLAKDCTIYSLNEMGFHDIVLRLRKVEYDEI